MHLTNREWIEHVNAGRQGLAATDLSAAEDLAIGLMNLISLEEHAAFSFMKTQDKKYLEVLQAVRDIRKSTMQRLVSAPGGEEWCMSKHLLAASMRLYETGTKEIALQRHDAGTHLMNLAFDCFALFFSLNHLVAAPTGSHHGNDSGMGNLDAPEPLVESEARHAAQPTDQSQRKSPAPLMAQLRTIVKKIVDCCKE